MTTFTPIRAAKQNDALLEKLFSQGASLAMSPKYDGIRAIVYQNKLLSRTLKDIPNVYLRELLSTQLMDGLDGELVFGDGADPQSMSKTSSAVMSQDGKPDVTFRVFDCFREPNLRFRARTRSAWNKVEAAQGEGLPVAMVPQYYVTSMDEVSARLQMFLDEGYEGGMIRNANETYRMGLSTASSVPLMKLKPFEDSEAEILGFGEMLRGEDSQPAGMMGYMNVRDLHNGWDFSIGTGFSHELARHIWENQSAYLGKVVNYCYQAHGMQTAPRHPAFRAFRDRIDIVVDES